MEEPSPEGKKQLDMQAEDGGFYEDFNPPASGDSDRSGEEGSDGETIEVKTKEQTFYYANQEGMAQCEYCGRYGVRDAFYSKTKQFCSMTCSKKYVVAVKEGQPIPKQTGILPLQIKTLIKKDRSPAKKQYHFNLTRPQNGLMTFSWDKYLDSSQTNAAPVNLFRHCPMSKGWDNIAEGMKVEIVNKDCPLKDTTVYWVATVMKLAGYKAKMRYEGYGTESSKDFWLNLCLKEIYPVGWCAHNGKPLVPPKCIEGKYRDWKEFLVRRLTGARTLPQDFYYLVQEELRDIPLQKGMKVEVVDKMCVSSMRVATVEEVIGGRLMLRYDNSPYDNDTFWCHYMSPLLHPVGWSHRVGHKITAPAEYIHRVNTKVVNNEYEVTDTTEEMLPKPAAMNCDSKFTVGMKLEAIDPLNLSAICVATVRKILRHDYVMVGIDGSLAHNGSDWFSYHATSPSIFPVGFCEINGLHITPPKNYKCDEFKWFEYLKHSKAVAAPVKLFDKEIPQHRFRKGMKLEAVDLMDPRLICVGTVEKVVGRLLCIHFDGWDSSYDQWIDCRSPDIYPVGWCEMVGYYLEGPRNQVQEMALPKALKSKVPTKRRRAKSQVYRGPRKKRKSKVGSHVLKLEPQSSLDFSEQSQDGTTDISTVHEEVGSSTVVSPAASSTQSALSSSVPAIATMLNSPPRHQLQPLSPTPASPTTSPTTSLAAAINQVTMHAVPRLSEGLGSGGGSGAVDPSITPPRLWSVFDVCQFLRINDCATHCDTFRKREIDGPRFMELSKEQIVNLTGMKVGPSLKIFDLIQALKKQYGTGAAATPASTAASPPPPPPPPPPSAAAQLTASQILAQAKRTASLAAAAAAAATASNSAASASKPPM